MFIVSGGWCWYTISLSVSNDPCHWSVTGLLLWFQLFNILTLRLSLLFLNWHWLLVFLEMSIMWSSIKYANNCYIIYNVNLQQNCLINFIYFVDPLSKCFNMFMESFLISLSFQSSGPTDPRYPAYWEDM